jgi:MFS transporter, SET family, sugar efflux transporter
MWTAAAVMVLTAAGAAAIPAPRAPQVRRDQGDRPVRTPVLLVTAVGLFFLAMFAGSVVLPLYVTRGLHQGDSAVGLMFSVCAAVEIVAALGLAALPSRVSQRALITAAMAALAAFYVITVSAPAMTMLLGGQVARGVAIASSARPGSAGSRT